MFRLSLGVRPVKTTIAAVALNVHLKPEVPTIIRPEKGSAYNFFEVTRFNFVVNYYSDVHSKEHPVRSSAVCMPLFYSWCRCKP